MAESSSPAPRPSERYMHMVFKWLVILTANCILVQIFVAGLSVFVDDARWADHVQFGRYLSVLPLLMLAVSFPANLPKKVRMQVVDLIVMIVLMFVTAIFSPNIGWLAAFHPVIAAVLFFRAMSIVRDIRQQ